MSRKKNNQDQANELQLFVNKHKRLINKTVLAETLGCSLSTVSMVIGGNRKDYYKILEAAEKIIKVQL